MHASTLHGTQDYRYRYAARDTEGGACRRWLKAHACLLAFDPCLPGVCEMIEVPVRYIKYTLLTFATGARAASRGRQCIEMVGLISPKKRKCCDMQQTRIPPLLAHALPCRSVFQLFPRAGSSGRATKYGRPSCPQRILRGTQVHTLQHKQVIASLLFLANVPKYKKYSDTRQTGEQRRKPVSLLSDPERKQSRVLRRAPERGPRPNRGRLTCRVETHGISPFRYLAVTRVLGVTLI